MVKNKLYKNECSYKIMFIHREKGQIMKKKTPIDVLTLFKTRGYRLEDLEKIINPRRPVKKRISYKK